MNLPNKLTVLRMVMIPLFLVFFLSGGIPNNNLWALITFAAAAITDTLDGNIARKRGLVTDFGKFMDPLADKLLVMAALVAFVEVLGTPSVVIIIILAREFLVTALRTLAANKGVVIAADNWGKIKTVLQMFWIVYTLLLCWLEQTFTALPVSWDVLYFIYSAGMVLVALITVVSGFNYIWKNRNLFLNDK